MYGSNYNFDFIDRFCFFYDFVLDSQARERYMYKGLYDDAFGKTIILIRENENLAIENRRLHQENTTLNSAFYDVQRRAAKTSIKDDDIVEAVRYAMKKAHPDNGGEQADFIKFNNLYNKIR